MSIGDFEPFWLDPNGRCLYAALHAGASGHAMTGVVLVPPLFHELARSRRFVTEVASGLAIHGAPSLRFDFFGTGDSCGSGDQLDFASMLADVELAIAELRERTRVERVALLAWRAAALPLVKWLEQGGNVDLLVLWDPIVDGASWLDELEREDANERAERPGLRPGIPSINDPLDGQLMGFPASARLRDDLAKARLASVGAGSVPAVWMVARGDVLPPLDVERHFALPDSAPSFNGGAAMDATFFLTPPMQSLIDELGRSLMRTWQ